MVCAFFLFWLCPWTWSSEALCILRHAAQTSALFADDTLFVQLDLSSIRFLAHQRSPAVLCSKLAWLVCQKCVPSSVGSTPFGLALWDFWCCLVVLHKRGTQQGGPHSPTLFSRVVAARFDALALEWCTRGELPAFTAGPFSLWGIWFIDDAILLFRNAAQLAINAWCRPAPCYHGPSASTLQSLALFPVCFLGCLVLWLPSLLCLHPLTWASPSTLRKLMLTSPLPSAAGPLRPSSPTGLSLQYLSVCVAWPAFTHVWHSCRCFLEAVFMCLASHPVQPPALARPPLHSSDVALGWPGSCLLVFSGMHWGSSEWGGDVGTSICRTTGLFACHYGAAVGWTCSSHGAHEFGPSSFAFLAQHNRVFAVTELGPIMVVIELSCGIWPIKALCFAIVPFHLSKVLRLPRKSEAGSYEVLTQNHLSKPTDLMLQNATHLRKPVSWPLTSLMNMSLALRLPREMHLCRSSSNVPRLPLFLEMLQNLYVLLTFDKVHNPLRLPCQTTSERPKVVSGRGPSVFNTFDFEICFAPQRRALFHHLNFQGRSENGVFCTFWLWNVLRATRAGNFSSLISPDGSAPAALASLLSDPPEPRIFGKT